MKRSQFLLVTLFLFCFFYNFFLIIKNRSQAVDDRQATTLIQKNLYFFEKNLSKTFSDEKRSFSFVANNNNLGIIALLFNSHEKIAYDEIWFRLKELNSEKWIYEQMYDTKKIDKGYYTFGFPPIPNSKGKEYLVEIESISGKLDNSISMYEDSDFFISKYSYSKSYLFQNKKEIIPFIKNKGMTYLHYLSFGDVKDIFLKTIFGTIAILVAIYVIKIIYVHIINKYFFILNKRKKDIVECIRKYFNSPNILLEIFAVLTPIILFCDLALISLLVKQVKPPFFILIILFFINLFYLFIISKTLARIIRLFYKYSFYPILLPIGLFIFLRLRFMDALPRWDGAVYYSVLLRSLSDFNFTLSSFMAFNWFNHPSMGFGLFSAIFQFLNPDNIFMLNVGNTILAIVAILSFYLVSLYFFSKKRNTEIILLTALFALNPLFFSVSTSFLPDFGVLVFFLAGLVSFFYKKNVLTLFFFLMTIFSKETGAYTYVLFVLFYLLIVLVRRLPIIKAKYLISYIFLLIPGVIYFFYLLYTKGSHWNAGEPLGFASNCFFCFSIQPAHFVQNLHVMFLLNFSWILTLIAVLSFIKQIIAKKITFPIKNNFKKDEFLSLVFSFFGFVAFFMVFVIYIIPSYMLLSIFFLILIFYYSLLKLFKNGKTRLALLLFISFLFLIQNFVNIDLFSSKIFGFFKFGKYKMIKVGSEYLCDGLIYNTQYLYIDRLINKFHRDFKIRPDDIILMNASQWNSFYLGGASYNLYIDNISLEKTFTESRGFRPNIYNIDVKGESLPLLAYYLAFPWMENEEESIEMVKNLYNINKKTKIEIDGYWINVYSLTKK